MWKDHPVVSSLISPKLRTMMTTLNQSLLFTEQPLWWLSLFKEYIKKVFSVVGLTASRLWSSLTSEHVDVSFF